MATVVEETMAEPATLQENIDAFGEQHAGLAAQHLGKWVLFYDRELVDVFDEYADAAQVADERFGDGPCLITQVGSPAVTLPISVLYGPFHSIHALRA